MKIFIPYPVKDIGGTSIFIKKFQKGMQTRGHEVFFKHRPDYDYLFAVVVCYPQYLLEAKIKGKKIVQRLDGMFSYTTSGWNYLRLNFPAWVIRVFFSHYTIYQSHYSKYCVNKFIGKRKHERSSLIYNGVDINQFSPHGEKIRNIQDNPEQQIFITASKFRRKDQIIPIIDALKKYEEEYTSNFKFLAIGEFMGEAQDIPQQYESLPFIKFPGKVPNGDLPKYLRSSDVFLITHLNPPCPNNVIEAMASGLPLCGVNDGAMSELTEPGKNSLLIPTEGDAFWQPRALNTSLFSKNINIIMQNREQYSQASRTQAEKRFSLDTMIEKYIQAFESLESTNKTKKSIQ